MSTTTTERPLERATDHTTDRSSAATWTCPNCHGDTTTAKKRCRDCGTSRW